MLLAVLDALKDFQMLLGASFVSQTPEYGREMEVDFPRPRTNCRGLFQVLLSLWEFRQLLLHKAQVVLHVVIARGQRSRTKQDGLGFPIAAQSAICQTVEVQRFGIRRMARKVLRGQREGRFVQ